MPERRHHTRFPAPLNSLQALLCAVFILLVFPAAGYSGQWRVAPARIFLDREAKSSVITVVNEGDEKINLQGKAMEWSQDPDGKDVYQETKDLVFFPRILMIDKGEQKIIRAGIKIPVTAKEKTYRLFIEEIPQPKKKTADTAQLTVAVRFGIPVFVKPLKEELVGELASTALTRGIFSTIVKNTGNTHFRIIEISIKGRNVKGEETFAEKLNGWYLLAGANRLYSTPIPAGKCGATEQLDITVTTDTKIIFNRHLNVDKGQCLP
jgi:fimbrial chaperone protein